MTSSWLNLAKMGGGLLIGLCAALVVWLAQDRFRQKDIADNAARCEVAASKDDGDDLDDCLPNIALRIVSARRAVRCENAIFPELRPETRSAAGQHCTAGTQRLIAQGDAQASQIESLNQSIQKMRQDSAAAVARAEARGRSEQVRRDNARQTIEAAPQDAYGRITCNAECLRKLTR